MSPPYMPKLQLRKLELPLADIIVCVPATLFGDHIHTELPERFDVRIYSPALDGDSLGIHLLNELLQRERMVLICLIKEYPHQV